jgi:hypothetical protein
MGESASRDQAPTSVRRAPTDDRELIRPSQLVALSQMLSRPTFHTQRMVEQLTFLESGGQRWNRDLQILLPLIPGLDGPAQFIVSLGMFVRRRFPDFAAFTSGGDRLNLLTRLQHGHALTYCALDQYLDNAQKKLIAEGTDDDATNAYVKVYQRLVALFVSAGTSSQQEIAAEAGAEELHDLLTVVGVESETADGAAELFRTDFVALAGVTQYLCWVTAAPGSVINVAATYTMADPAQLPSKLPRFRNGDGRLRRALAWTQEARTHVYARAGLGPINYELRTPANDHAGSYYFTVKPPVNSRVTYIDWDRSNSFDALEIGEADCADHSVHLHNGVVLAPKHEDVPSPRSSQSIAGSTIHAYVRPEPIDHKQIAFGALLNLLFVYLAESGRLASPELGGSATFLLLLSPTVLLAYTAQNQRHYYSDAIGWLRAGLWIYLAIDVVFLVSLAFNVAPNHLHRQGFSDDVSSLLMAFASFVVVTVYSLIGNLYDRTVRIWYYRRRAKKGADVERPGVEAYVEAARRYGDVIVGLLIAGVVVSLVVLF